MNPLTQEEKNLLLEILTDRKDTKMEQLRNIGPMHPYPCPVERREVRTHILADWADLDRLITKLDLTSPDAHNPPCNDCKEPVPIREALGWDGEVLCHDCFAIRAPEEMQSRPRYLFRITL